MKKEKGANILEFIGNIIYEKNQVEDYSVYLTINKVFQFTGKAEIDFGGSEYKKAETEEIKTFKRKPEDKYGWWELSEGEYLVEFNEELEKLLPESKLVILQPSERITLNGTSHATKIIEKKGKFRLTLHVGKNGINIKENARISKLIALD
jgi:hypothetical protein